MTAAGHRIAVADDDASVCRALKRLLRSAGFEVETYCSGTELLESVGSWRPDCLVLDIRMPEMTGLEVQARLQADGITIPVIIITAFDNPEERQQALRSGAVACLRKPFSDGSLFDAIRTCVQARGSTGTGPKSNGGRSGTGVYMGFAPPMWAVRGMRVNRVFLQVVLVAGLGVGPMALARAQQSEPAPTLQPQPAALRRAIEPRAEELLRQMSSFLARTERFVLEAEETFDELPDRQPRHQLTNVRRVAVQRPDRLAADVAGDSLNRDAWYDGRALTLLDKEHGVYSVLAAPATIDATLDLLQDEYGVVLPLADLIYGDPYAVLMEGVTYGRYLGIHVAAGLACHHLVFAQATIEWQIWIDAGEAPLPRKLVITYVGEPGEPQYSATVRKWVLEPEFPAELFAAEPPDWARKVDFASLGPGLATAGEGARKAGPRTTDD